MKERNSTQPISTVDADSKVCTDNKTNKLSPRYDLFETDLSGRWIRQRHIPISTLAKSVGAYG